VGKIYIVTY